jgi:hypothetical protein
MPPMPAQLRRDAKACDNAPPVKASESVDSRGASLRTSAGLGMVASDLSVLCIIVCAPFVTPGASEMRAQRGDPKTAGRKLPKRKGMRPFDNSADPPAECLPVGG